MFKKGRWNERQKKTRKEIIQMEKSHHHHETQHIVLEQK